MISHNLNTWECYEFKDFLKERDVVLLSLDKEKILNYLKKYGEEIDTLLNNDTVFWASVHKARIAITNFPKEEIEKSKKWLIANEFKPY
jgi:hypothetical protein